MKTKINYADKEGLLLGREVRIGLKDGTMRDGEVRYLDANEIVLVIEPTSKLSIETDIIHTIINREQISFTQFKTSKE